MKILHLNSTTTGGAARAMLRLHEGLQAIGVNSISLSWDGISGNPPIASMQTSEIKKRLLMRIDSLPLRLYSKRKKVEFNLQWVPSGIHRAVNLLRPDIIHLHWICRSFLTVEDLRKICQPIVWTMHDSWTFTGGCHVPYDCVRYREGCGRCPQLVGSRPWDLSRWLWQRKLKSWRAVGMTAVAPSRWLGECAGSSPLLRDKDIRVIPNGLDLEAFQLFDRLLSRQALRLPTDKTLLLFGGVSPLTDRNKGFHFLKPALAEVARHVAPASLELVVIGDSAPRVPEDLGISVRYMGRLHDDTSLRLVFAAADVSVLPSLYEAFGQMASESLACGTPVVAFNATGYRDIVDHGVNGYLATPYEPADLGVGIAEIIARPDKEGLRQAARAKAVREYGLATMVERYMALYGELLQASKDGSRQDASKREGA